MGYSPVDGQKVLSAFTQDELQRVIDENEAMRWKLRHIEAVLHDGSGTDDSPRSA
jgi:hypothetical protein